MAVVPALSVAHSDSTSEVIHASTINEITGFLDGLGILNALDYGADPTGTADSSTAINAAIAALPTTGGIVRVPAGTFKCNSTINIGNGSSSGVSSRAGVVLQGASPAGFGMLSIDSGSNWPVQASTRLVSGTATTMISVNGPLQSWGLRNLHLDGNSLGTIGTLETSAQGGASENCVISNFTQFAQLTQANVKTGALSTILPNHMHNVYRNWVAWVPDINGAIGIKSTGNYTDTSSNSCYDTWEHVVIHCNATTGHTIYGFFFEACDNVTLRDAHFIVGTGGTNNKLIFNYPAVFPQCPADCRIDSVDLCGNSGSIINNGSAGSATGPNRITNISTCNGTTTNPALANLQWGYSATI